MGRIQLGHKDILGPQIGLKQVDCDGVRWTQEGSYERD